VLIEAFGTNLEFSRELAPLTSYGTGGNARYFLEADSGTEIIRAIKSARRLRIPWFVMGGGSNLLVSDEGFDGLVIKAEVLGLKFQAPDRIEAGAGEDLMALVNFATAHALTGLEFASGIWGTVGGAVYGNAGAYGGEVGRILTEAQIIDHDGELKTVTPDYLEFDYRYSRLKETREIMVSAVFRAEAGDKDKIAARVAEILQTRAGRHPDHGTAGCFFRNIPDETQKYGKLPAGKLLEEAGAKDLTVGGAAVYAKHANIIVNTGGATSKDIRRLADMMKQKVLDRFGIELQEEVQVLGTFD
jgi:UDP-N-acetylmuramate dehydrogenase